MTRAGEGADERRSRRPRERRATGRHRVLASAFDPHRNSLNALRLLLATLVIVSHAWPIGGFGADPAVGGIGLGGWAVAGFFGISGFLITGSRQRSSAGTFLFRRFLRIFPGLWVCLIAVAFAFAPLAAATEPGSQDISPHGLARYVAANGLLMHGREGIGGTLAHAPYASTWNGSLWTLFYEFACYLVVGALFAVPVVRRRPTAWIGGLLATFILITVAAVELDVSMPARVRIGAYLGTYFFAGALLSTCAARVRMHGLYAGAAVGILAVAIALGHAEVVAAVPVAFLVLWLGVTLPLADVGRRNDISYGIYIYAFPVQQLLVRAGAQHLGVAAYAVLGIAATIPFAAASWFVVERPAMALRRLYPARLVPGRAPA